MRDDGGLSIEELAERAEVPVRTVRYYISEGLLPGPGMRGKGALYSEEHLLRLLLIRRLSEQRVPLSEQRERLGGLSVDEVRALLGEAEERNAELTRTRQARSPAEYIAALLRQAQAASPERSPPSAPPVAPPMAARAAPRFSASAPPPPSAPPSSPRRRAEPWRRWELAPGVELHVQAEAERRERALIERLLRAASADEERS